MVSIITLNYGKDQGFSNKKGFFSQYAHSPLAGYGLSPTPTPGNFVDHTLLEA